MQNSVHSRFRVCLLVAAFCSMIVMLLGRTVCAQDEVSSDSELPFNPIKLMSPRRAIVNAPFLPADQVKDRVGDTELVLGVVIDGVPRAYPINMLTGPAREIINDRIGKTDFAATW